MIERDGSEMSLQHGQGVSASRPLRRVKFFSEALAALVLWECSGFARNPQTWNFASLSCRISLEIRIEESPRASNTGREEEFGPVKECHKEEDKSITASEVHYRSPVGGKLPKTINTQLTVYEEKI